MSNSSPVQALRGAIVLGLTWGLVVLNPATVTADLIDEIDEACASLEVQDIVGSWTRVSVDIAGRWLATGTVGDARFGDAQCGMLFEDDVLFEEIRRGSSPLYRSLTGVDGQTTKSIWLEVASGECWMVEGSLTTEGETAARRMGNVQLDYGPVERPKGYVHCGCTCTSNQKCDDLNACPSTGTCPACTDGRPCPDDE